MSTEMELMYPLQVYNLMDVLEAFVEKCAFEAVEVCCFQSV